VSGVAIPRIVLKDFRQFPIVLPPKNIQDEFGYMVTPLFDLIYVLLKKNSILKAARDQLLPKLISGELDVSDRLGGKNGNNLSLPS
jgi:type I restriction enzyme, S subunit